jgi:hypothetical protein
MAVSRPAYRHDLNIPDKAERLHLGMLRRSSLSTSGLVA